MYWILPGIFATSFSTPLKKDDAEDDSEVRALCEKDWQSVAELCESSVSNYGKDTLHFP